MTHLRTKDTEVSRMNKTCFRKDDFPLSKREAFWKQSSLLELTHHDVQQNIWLKTAAWLAADEGFGNLFDVRAHGQKIWRLGSDIISDWNR